MEIIGGLILYLLFGVVVRYIKRAATVKQSTGRSMPLKQAVPATPRTAIPEKKKEPEAHLADAHFNEEVFRGSIHHEEPFPGGFFPGFDFDSRQDGNSDFTIERTGVSSDIPAHGQEARVFLHPFADGDIDGKQIIRGVFWHEVLGPCKAAATARRFRS